LKTGTRAVDRVCWLQMSSIDHSVWGGTEKEQVRSLCELVRRKKLATEFQNTFEGVDRRRRWTREWPV